MASTLLGRFWPVKPQTDEHHDYKESQRTSTVTGSTTQGSEEDAAEEADSTPKASPQEPGVAVPTFSLNDDTQAPVAKPTVPPVVQATPSSGDGPSQTLSPNTTQKNAPRPPSSNLMAPPPRPSSLRAPAAPSTTSLRVPSSGPLPNRGPPGNSQQRAGSSKGRGKVLLSPGHSPMDWASLTRSKNLSGVPTFQRVTPSQLKTMTGRKGKDAWSSYQGKVYNITPYLPFHPGGESELMKAAGRDGTKLFMDVHPWVNWEGMMSACLVGVMVSEGAVESALDAID